MILVKLILPIVLGFLLLAWIGSILYLGTMLVRGILLWMFRMVERDPDNDNPNSTYY